MDDWRTFNESVPWFVKDTSNVRIVAAHDGFRVSSPVADTFPTLAELCRRASVTSVSVDGVTYLLLTWTGRNGCRMGWLCLPPATEPPQQLFADHRALLHAFGGIVERFNEPEDTWLLNHNEVLTAGESSHDATFINHYAWAFHDVGIAIPINLTDYYSIAGEANGNTTLCNRLSGQVILFAPDHSFNFVTPLAGCPEYTLYQLDGISDFRDWVEHVSLQWLAKIA